MLKNNVNYLSYSIKNKKNLNYLYINNLKFNFNIFLRQLDKYFFIWWNYDSLHANLNVRIVNTFQRWHMYYSSYTYYDFLCSLKLGRKDKNIRNVKK